ncbi:syntaxin-18 [Trichogramma pretiosum]|uniref:syntaxin-18 n=1 Tax=Trichogramma pretiosum TaxID=7493 RepID=UPI0006C9BF41|nr:syntaxin-18 [Trichogramma pretiosum]
MDSSLLFKSCVKQVGTGTVKGLNSTNIFTKPPSKQSIFAINAYKITKEISEMHKLLNDRRQAYLTFTRNLRSEPFLTELDKDTLDAQVDQILTTCSKMIADLKVEIKTSDSNLQHKEHRENMVSLIEDYLKQVMKIFTDQKSLRLQKKLDMRDSLESRLMPLSNSEQIPPTSNSRDLNSSNDSEVNDNPQESSLRIQELNGDTIDSTFKEIPLSAEDIQMFDEEKEQFFNELNLVSEEIQQIERKVVGISELTQAFNEKIHDQDLNIDNIAMLTIGSTEKVKEGNEQVREAIQRRADARAWILFVLLVLSFTLIFLDWYAD